MTLAVRNSVDSMCKESMLTGFGCGNLINHTALIEICLNLFIFYYLSLFKLRSWFIGVHYPP